MGQQHSFTEYVSVRFENELTEAIDHFIKENTDNIELSLRSVRNIDSDSIEIMDIAVKWVNVNAQNDMKICFDVSVEAEIYVRDSDHHLDHSETVTQWFLIRCKGDLDQHLDDFEIYAPVEVYSGKYKQDDPLSDALVPIIKHDELDGIASIFLKENYGIDSENATPVRIDPFLLAERMGLKIQFLHITKDASVFGRCYFCEHETELYDPDTDSFYKKVIPEKTILVDETAYFLRTIGSSNNTIIHECVHWDKHRKAFALVKLYSDDVSSIGCRVVGGISGHEKDAFGIMEWQANVLTPRIQMPMTMFKKKVNSLISEVRAETNEYEMIAIIEPLIDRVADFFGVSRTAAKIRMVEAGWDEAIGAFNYVDGHYVQPHKSQRRLEKDQTFTISETDAGILAFTDQTVRKALDSGRYLYVDGHFVLNSSLYVLFDEETGSQLTHYALTHMDECCLLFKMSMGDAYGQKYHSECFLNRDEYSDVHPEFHYSSGLNEDKNKVLDDDIESIYALLLTLDQSFTSCLKKAMAWRNTQIAAYNKKHPSNKKDKITRKEIAARAEIGISSVERAFNDNLENDISTETAVLICLAMHIPPPISEHIMKLAPHPLVLSKKTHQWYATALRMKYGVPVKEAREFLKSHNAPL